jgi:hypothetical protein
MDWTIVVFVLVLVLVPGVLFIWLMSDTRPRDMIRSAMNLLQDGGARAADGTRGGLNRGRGSLGRGLTDFLGVAKGEVAEWRRVQHRIREQPKVMTCDSSVATPPRMSETAQRRFTERWYAVQLDFLDDPQRSLIQADSLVRDMLHECGYSSDGGDGVVAEYRELRRFTPEATFDTQRDTMLGYRSLFERLVANEEPAPTKIGARVANGSR